MGPCSLALLWFEKPKSSASFHCEIRWLPNWVPSVPGSQRKEHAVKVPDVSMSGLQITTTMQPNSSVFISEKSASWSLQLLRWSWSCCGSPTILYHPLELPLAQPWNLSWPHSCASASPWAARQATIIHAMPMGKINTWCSHCSLQSAVQQSWTTSWHPAYPKYKTMSILLPKKKSFGEKQIPNCDDSVQLPCHSLAQHWRIAYIHLQTRRASLDKAYILCTKACIGKCGRFSIYL